MVTFTETDLETPTEADLDSAYGSKYLATGEIGEKKIKPIRMECDEHEKFPWSVVEEMRKAELLDERGRHEEAVREPMALDEFGLVRNDARA